ncbi:MAG: efflux RND transporter periplasmic adaptor subunit [Pseudomonadota bacterium]
MLKHNETLETQTASQDDEAPRERSVVSSLARGIFQFILMAAVLGAGAYGMNHLTALKEDPPSRPPFKTVYTVERVTVQKGEFQPSLTVYGEVQAAKSVELRSLVAGKVVWVNPELKTGARVEKGEELFKIDQFSFEKELATAKANHSETLARISENEARIGIEKSRISRTQDQLKLAENDLERITSLSKNGTATAKQVEDRAFIVSQRKQALEQSELNLVAEGARLEQQKAILSRHQWAINQAERNLKDTVFLAPSSGIVNEKSVAIGRLLGANDMAISMYEADRLEVRATLTDQRFGRIQSDDTGLIGRPVKMIWSVGGEEHQYEAVIERITARIESSRGGVEVIAAISDALEDSALRPGAFVELIVPDKKFSNHFRVPETAIYDNDTVYVIRDGVLESRQIVIHAHDGNHTIINGNIADGDEVLITRIAEISNGIRVKSPKTSSVEGDENQVVGKVQ